MSDDFNLPAKNGPVNMTLGRKMLDATGGSSGFKTKRVGDQMLRTRNGWPEFTRIEEEIAAPTSGLMLIETAYSDRTFFVPRIIKSTDLASDTLTLGLFYVPIESIKFTDQDGDIFIMNFKDQP